MQKQLLLFLSMMLSTFSYAQTETLFSDDNSYGGFGGPMIEFSNINGTLVGDVGGGGGLVINDFFVGGYGLGTEGATVDFQEQTYDIGFGHGGLWFGYTFNQDKLIHIYSSFRVGWGSAKLRIDGDKKYSDNLLALAPEAGIELNVTDWFKLGVSGGYRYVSGVDDLPVLTSEDFTGMYGALTFRFGGFGDYDSHNHNHGDDDDDDFDF